MRKMDWDEERGKGRVGEGGKNGVVFGGGFRLNKCEGVKK